MPFSDCSAVRTSGHVRLRSSVDWRVSTFHSVRTASETFVALRRCPRTSRSLLLIAVSTAVDDLKTCSSPAHHFKVPHTRMSTAAFNSRSPLTSSHDDPTVSNLPTVVVCSWRCCLHPTRRTRQHGKPMIHAPFRFRIAKVHSKS